MLQRRDFLSRSLALGAAAALTPISRLSAAANEPPFQISLAQWSLHLAIFGKKGDKLDPMDFPKVTKEKFGINAVEYVNQFYKDKKNSDDAAKELRKRCDDLGVKSVLIMCDGEGDLGDPDEKKRKQAVSNHERWLAWAKILGCHSIRVNAKSKGTFEEQQKLAAEGLRGLCELGEKYDQNIIVENHGGLSSNGAWLAGTIKQVGHKRAGTLPDFGNFWINRTKGKEELYDRYKGTAELMPYAKGVSAKSYDFDEKGNETTIDYFKMMDIVLGAGYKGFVGIEYEGSRLSEADGILATKKLLERIQQAKAK